MTTDSRQVRNKLRITGAIAGLLVWTSLSGVGSLSVQAGLFLGLLTAWMLSALLIWAACSGDTGGREQAPPADEAPGVPGWLLIVIVVSLLIWIGLSGIGEMSGPAGFLFALLAMVGLSGIVIWARHGTPDEELGDHRFAMLPDPADPPPPAVAATAPPSAAVEAAPAPAPAPQPAAAEATPAADGAPDDLKRIKGIGPVLEDMLHKAGVTRLAEIAAWDEAAIDAMAARIGPLGGRIRSDDWVGQARALAGKG